MASSPAATPSVALRPLLDRRLVIVTGKGGTGKTTVVATLALAAARAGLRVLVAEMERCEQLHRLLEPGSLPLDYAGRELAPGIRGMRIEPFEALAEYLGLQLGVRALVDLIMRNRAFRQLMSAAPGWRDLIILGKVWHLEQMREADGRPRYDLIVVDAPATGHGVTFLDVPRVVVSAVRAGPLRRTAQRVEDLIEDAERTLLLPVALAEELPARETVELVDRLSRGVGIAVDRVVVNGMAPPPFPAPFQRLDERLARVPADLDLGELPRPAELLACARMLRSRYELNLHYRDEISRRTELPGISLPYLSQGIGGPDEIELLVDALLADPEHGP